MDESDLTNSYATILENGEVVIDCSGIPRMSKYVSKPVNNGFRNMISKHDITDSTRAIYCGDVLFLETTSCTSDRIMVKRMAVPIDFLYTELQSALHPAEPVPLDKDDPNYPTSSMVAVFWWRTTEIGCEFESQISENPFTTELVTSFKMFFGYHVTKRGSYYCLGNKAFPGNETEEGLFIKMGKVKMEKLLQFLRKFLCEFNDG